MVKVSNLISEGEQSAELRFLLCYITRLDHSYYAAFYLSPVTRSSLVSSLILTPFVAPSDASCILLDTMLSSHRLSQY
jgi:hypothetical protein